MNRMLVSEASKLYQKLKNYLLMGWNPEEDNPEIKWSPELFNNERRPTFEEFVKYKNIELVLEIE